MMSDETQKKRQSPPPGSRWRVLAHRGDGDFEVQNEGCFDELVVDQWLHVEQMDDRKWWIRVGEACVWATIADDGSVTVQVGGHGYETLRPE